MPPIESRRAKPAWLIRLGSWEYWPFEVVYAPVFLYWLWLSVRARSLFFFSASNPSIETGGMLGESKWGILRRIAPDYVPKTIYVAEPQHTDALLQRIEEEKLTYPLIAKPDVGQRGQGVEKIEHWEQLVNYAQAATAPFLVQAYADEPIELGVFYYRMPGAATGVVTSIVQKVFLQVRGTGRDTLADLILQDDRATLQWPVLQRRLGSTLAEVLPEGEVRMLEPIGNHCRGTMFLNANHLIRPELTAVFDHITDSLGEVYFGRYDIRCRSEADLYAGRHIQIMEFNGAGAEPGHIYQPGFSLWRAWGVLLHHWRVLFDISRANHRRGVPYLTLSEARRFWQQHKTPTHA
jgi:hypothetical protein